MTFTTRYFEMEHGRKPSGRGNWAFCDESKARLDNYLDFVYWSNGLYSEAKKNAAAHFKSLSVNNVVVLS